MAVAVAAAAALGLAAGSGTAWAQHQHGAEPDPVLARYQEVRDQLFRLLDTDSARAALARLRALIDKDASTARFCHALVHEMGHRAYAKYQDFGAAMRYHDDICNSGYLHGVIETYFSTQSDIEAALRAVCAPYPAKTHFGWQCYHGVGHGLMFYTANDLPRSLGMCDRYAGLIARTACVNGVFMENFNTEPNRRPSRFLKESDPFYPCPQQDLRHRGECYLYAPMFFLKVNRSDYRAGLEWCRGAEAAFRADCARGLGGQALKENVDRPALVEQVCQQGPRPLAAPCVEGMVNFVVAHYGALEPARELCGQLGEERSRRACARWVDRYVKAGFQRGPSETPQAGAGGPGAPPAAVR